MTDDRRRHPLFARFYRHIAEAAEKAGMSEHRRRLLVGLSGRVVEQGAGSGLNFRHYPTSVVEVIAVEPETYLRRAAEEEATQAPVPVRVVDGTATRIPLPDASVDAGVVSLVLCSVPDQAAALAELRRVIKPGGELRFFEHVVSRNPVWERRQRRIDPIWTRFAGGCHLTRDTEHAIVDAGFVIEDNDRFLFAPAYPKTLTAEHILGRAVRP